MNWKGAGVGLVIGIALVWLIKVITSTFTFFDFLNKILFGPVAVWTLVAFTIVIIATTVGAKS